MTLYLNKYPTSHNPVSDSSLLYVVVVVVSGSRRGHRSNSSRSSHGRVIVVGVDILLLGVISRGRSISNSGSRGVRV